MNRWDLPLNVLQDFAHLKRECYDKAQTYPELISLTTEEFSLRFEDKTLGKKFFFNIAQPSGGSGSGTPVVNLNFRPHTHNNLSTHSGLMEMGSVMGSLTRWIDLLIAYNQVNLNPEERFLAVYENEYYEEFRSLEEDGEAVPLDDRQQRMLGYLLDAVETAVAEADVPAERKQEIIAEARALSNTAPKLSKNQVVRRLSRIIAKVKTLGWDVVKEVTKEVKTTLIKMAAKKAIDLAQDLPRWLSHFHH